MNKMISLALIGVLSGSMLSACNRQRVVQAGNEPTEESGIYQPRQALPPDSPEAIRQRAKNDRTVVGQLIKVDLANNTIAILTENGMEQTFRLDNTTMVNGSSTTSKGTRTNELSGKEGEILIIEWEDHSGPKLAMSVDVK
jgi:hypothetical protein